MRRRMRKTLTGPLALLAALLTLAVGTPQAIRSAEPQKLKVLTVDPLMELMVRFIGGPYVDTASGWRLSDDGTLRPDRSFLKDDKASLPLIALTRQQYDDFAASAASGRKRRALSPPPTELRPGLCCLLDGRAFSGDWQNFYGDPANLPFTAQRVMDVLSRLDGNNYRFYQRRLGEFNARLRSVLISGRGRLRGVTVLCLGSWYVPFFRAWGCRINSPDDDELKLIDALASSDTEKTAAALAHQLRKGRVVVTDGRLSAKKRWALKNFAGAVVFVPDREEDFLFFIHHVVLAVAGRLEQQKK